MSIRRRLAIAAFGTIGLVVVVAGLRWLDTQPALPAVGSESARRLAPGPHAVAVHDLTLVDPSRVTDANGDHPQRPERTLATRIWYPEHAPGDHPLAVYSHGFMSRRQGGEFIARHLASHGWVVVAADFPLTHFFAPGGPRVEDAVNQPGDVAFLISSLLYGAEGTRPFDGGIDSRRIAVVGLSLGGLTTTLVSFHPALRDPRVRAAVSIAGTGGIFEAEFFETAEVPFLMIAGTADAIIDYQANASAIPEKIRDGGLVSLAGGSHAGFDQMASGALRLFRNPDLPGCWALSRNLERDRAGSHLGALGGPEIGVVASLERMRFPCSTPPPEQAMNVGRQHAITLLATHAFLESRLAQSAEEREAHARYLASGLAADFPDVRFEAARPR